MIRYFTILFLTIIAIGCCSIDRKYFDFTDLELKHFSDYRIGDTIYFKSNLNDIDTITIVGFKTDIYKDCGGFIAPKPINSRWIEIKHLPIDKWHGTMQDDKGTVKIDYQGLFSFAKYPTDKSTEYSISYKDFYSRYDSIFAEFHKDTILLNGLRFDSYYICRNLYPERLKYSKSIEIVFWTDKYGLTAYKSKDGEIWTKIINK